VREHIQQTNSSKTEISARKIILRVKNKGCDDYLSYVCFGYLAKYKLCKGRGFV
jgi:hypothetical protein